MLTSTDWAPLNRPWAWGIRAPRRAWKAAKSPCAGCSSMTSGSMSSDGSVSSLLPAAAAGTPAAQQQTADEVLFAC